MPKVKKVKEESKIIIKSNINENSESKKDEEGNENGYFFVGLSCGYTFRNLIETLLHFDGSGLFRFDLKGFSYKNVQFDGRCIVEIPFEKEFLNYYQFENENDKEMSVSLNMEDFHKKIKDIRVQEMLRLFINPDEEKKGRKIYFQVCGNEEADITSVRHILSSYTDKFYAEIPLIQREPDRIISHEYFMKMGETFKIENCSYIFITKKKFKKETQLSFDVKTENNGSGALTLMANPGLFQPNDDDVPEVSTVKLPKSIFEKFSHNSKFNKDGVIRIFIENKSYALFELSFAYISFLRIFIKDVDSDKNE